jgi:tetratricopeptide (TPR) repeat protein
MTGATAPVIFRYHRCMLRCLSLVVITILIILAGTTFAAQGAEKSGTADVAQSARHDADLAETGHCAKALPSLRKTLRQHLADKELKRRIGLDGVRCAMTLNQPEEALNFLQVLSLDFPHDPEVLYVTVHAFSDLSTRSAQQLAREAPSSYQAHELNAEALEMQGKWEEAAKEYRWVLERNPRLPGIHFRLGRLLLSKQDPGPELASEAQNEFQQELKIDPSNAGAEYVLGELARQSEQWDDAVQHFARAAKLDVNFGDAYLGLGQSLISTKKYSEAIQPLEAAVKLEPQNPATHYNLAMAYSRTGRKQDAEKEFAIHRQMVQKESPAQDAPQ